MKNNWWFAVLIFLNASVCVSDPAQVTAVVETPTRIGDYEGNLNDPDDPAIWPHPSNPKKV